MHRTHRLQRVLLPVFIMIGLATTSSAQCEDPPSDDELGFVSIACCGDSVAVAPGTDAQMRLTYYLNGEFRDYTGCASWSVDRRPIFRWMLRPAS
jgi:hypothetical protein